MFRIALRQLRWTIIKPEFIICVIIGLMGYIFDLIRYVRFSFYLNQPLNIFEPYIVSSSNYVTATISVFALLFLISDVPYNAGDDSFVLMRTSFRGWVLAKAMYVFAFCIIYNLAIIIISLIFAAPFSYLHGLWSEPAITMSFKDPFLSVNMYEISFYAPEILTNLTPIQSAMHSFLLTTLYHISLSIVLLSLKIIVEHQYISLAVVYIIHALGYLPMLIIVGTRPFSLFANSLLNCHILSNENGTLALPTLKISYCMFSGIILATLLFLFSYVSIKKNISGGYHG